jgi:hypothetical protein
MSLLKTLFGIGKSKKPVETAPAPTIKHKGYTIAATPMTEGREFQVCGVISREIDGVVKEHRFIRVDKMPSRDDAIDLIFRKGQQIVDQMGDRMFS